MTKLFIQAALASLLIPLCASANAEQTDQQIISLNDAISLAQQNDPWLHSSRLKQSAVEHQSVAAGTLADPKVSIGMMNLPTDGWDFAQEGMTQFKVGVSQMFPRGDSLAIKSAQLKTSAQQFPLQREDRHAQLTQLISKLWLEAYLAQRTIALINQDRVLFEQMAQIAKANYSNAIGKTRQQDVIRAQLEIIQLEDRLTVEQQKLDTALERLNEWLQLFSVDSLDDLQSLKAATLPIVLPNELPKITLAYAQQLKPTAYKRSEAVTLLLNHPALRAIDVKHQVSKKAIELTEQQYKPQWGVNASYGYRDDMPSGSSRADLFSIGVSFDLPLFTENKQDKQVAAAVAESEAIKTDKYVMLKQMLSELEKELAQLQRLSERQALYKQQLIEQTHHQAEAALTAYTNDDGDFSDVVRARITELNANIAALKIDVDALKSVAKINYLLTQSNHSVAEQTNQQGDQ
ncbi:TolC family protein [Pseudoalteromonas sp. S16_S37]|uniref:TolC family protein n=1 Tax=Pseudoalteromonas sp. S16_S37 TaxID=2720228 RepID=UPI001681AAB4|nr:TolC family protein [Pseudoalteromonas sp. S16_S37]MBD1580692.1 TolC family protein [Pseudoalteromonas sp. S16_S37]